MGKRGGQVRSGDELNCFLKQEICEKVTEWQKSKTVEWKLVLMQLLRQCPAEWPDLCCIYYFSTCVLIYIEFFEVSYQIKPSSHVEKPRSKNGCFLYTPTSFENKISQWKPNRRLSSIRHFWFTYPPLKLFNSVTKKEWNTFSYRQGYVGRVFWFEQVSSWYESNIVHSWSSRIPFTSPTAFDFYLSAAFSIFLINNLCLNNR